MKKLFLFAGCLISLGCGGGGGESSDCSTLGAKIFGGETCNQSSRSPVVQIVTLVQRGNSAEEPYSICSGALVSLNKVLTSAHCFDDSLTQLEREQGFSISGFIARVGGDQGETIRLSQFILHPGYNETGPAGSPFDIAVASLSRVPNPPIGPIPLLVSEVTVPGSEITAFGYGTNDEGTDSILKAESFVVSEARGGNLNVVGDGDTSICSGDSGGPAVYTTKSGTVALAGVNSFVNREGLCIDAAADSFGFVDIQFLPVFDFIVSQVPDLAAG